MNSEPIKFTEVKDKRLLKATPMERKKLLFGDNSYNEYVAGVGLSLQRDCRVLGTLRSHDGDADDNGD